MCDALRFAGIEHNQVQFPVVFQYLPQRIAGDRFSSTIHVLKKEDSLVTFVLTVAISLVTEPKKDEELTGLVRGMTASTDIGETAWYRRPLFWALVSLATCVFLNLYFW